MLANARARSVTVCCTVYSNTKHKKRVRKSAMQLVFPNVDGRPYEATNLLRRVLHRALERGGL